MNGVQLCQELYTITVKNTREKEKFLYSFELFNNSKCIDICFYSTNSNMCPSKVQSNFRFGPGKYTRQNNFD